MFGQESHAGSDYVKRAATLLRGMTPVRRCVRLLLPANFLGWDCELGRVLRLAETVLDPVVLAVLNDVAGLEEVRVLLGPRALVGEVLQALPHVVYLIVINRLWIKIAGTQDRKNELSGDGTSRRFPR